MSETTQLLDNQAEEPPNTQLHSALITLEASGKLQRLWEGFVVRSRAFMVRSMAVMVVPLALVGLFLGPHLGTAANAPENPAAVLLPSEQMGVKDEIVEVKEIEEEKPIVTKTFKAYLTQYSRADSCHYKRNGLCLMASGKPVYVGAVACPNTLRLGTKIMIGDKTYTCEDRYAQRLDKMRGLPTIDVFVENNPRGRSVVEIAVLKTEK